MEETVIKRFIVGIDVGKRFHQAAIISDSGKSISRQIKFPNTTVGAETLITKIKEINPDNLPISFCLEATGHYWLSLYSFLVNRKYLVSVINPYQSDAWRKVQMSTTKTDKQDALLIADLYRFGIMPETKLGSEEYISLRNLTRFRVAVAQQIHDTKRRIVTVLDQIFPEFESFFPQIFGKTARALLSDFPTPNSLDDISLCKLTNLINKVSKGRFGRGKAEEIKGAAQNSFGVTFAMDSFSLELKLLLKQLEFLEEEIGTLEQEIEKIMGKIKTSITTLPGIGKILAAEIVAEIGDPARFKTSGQLVAFAGINPTVRQSGQFAGNKNHMAKKGSPYLRAALWQAAVTSTQFNPILKKYYDKKIKDGKPPMVIFGAVARKLAGIILALMRENKSFDPKI